MLNYIRQLSLGFNQPPYLSPPNPPVEHPPDLPPSDGDRVQTTPTPPSRVPPLLFNQPRSGVLPLPLNVFVRLKTPEILKILNLLKEDHPDEIKHQAGKFLRTFTNQPNFQKLLHHPEHLDTLLRGGILIIRETSLAKTSELTKQYLIAIFADLSKDEKLRALITRHPLRHELSASLLLNLEDPPSFPTTLSTKKYICVLLHNLSYKKYSFIDELQRNAGARLSTTLLNILAALLPAINNERQTCLEKICLVLQTLSIHPYFNQQLYSSQDVPITKILLTLLSTKPPHQLPDATSLAVYDLLQELIFNHHPFLEDITHHYISLTIQAIVTILNDYDQSLRKLSLAQKVTDILNPLVYDPGFRKHLTIANFQQLTTTLINILATKQYPEFKKSLAPVLELLAVDPLWRAHRLRENTHNRHRGPNEP